MPVRGRARSRTKRPAAAANRNRLASRTANRFTHRTGALAIDVGFRGVATVCAILHSPPVRPPELPSTSFRKLSVIAV